MYKYLLLSIILLLGACSSEQGNQNNHEQHHTKETHHNNEHHHNNAQHTYGDIQETTANKDILPSFLDGQDEKIVQTYKIVGNYADILEHMPCYCGCGETVGHRSNANCFIKERHTDGSITWDDHGTRCVVCIEIALYTAHLTNEGKTLKEIRETIDNFYKEGYMAPTDTPMPS